MQRHRFDILLAALIILLLSAPVVRLLGPGLHPLLAHGAVTVVFTLMLLSAVFAASQSRTTLVTALALAVPAILAKALNLWLDRTGLVIADHVLSICFLGYVVVVVLKFLFSGNRVTLNVICASLCIYLLLGVLWANVYSLLDVLEPESFAFIVAEDGAAGSMRFGGETSIFPLYYSFVTMTTLGYGDIVPTSSPARMFAAIEALVGQLYLAVLVARLVGLHISQSR